MQTHTCTHIHTYVVVVVIAFSSSSNIMMVINIIIIYIYSCSVLLLCNCACVYVWMNVCVYVCRYACMNVCMYEYVYACVHVCMYVCIYIYIYIYICIKCKQLLHTHRTELILCKHKLLNVSNVDDYVYMYQMLQITIKLYQTMYIWFLGVGSLWAYSLYFQFMQLIKPDFWGLGSLRAAPINLQVNSHPPIIDYLCCIISYHM